MSLIESIEENKTKIEDKPGPLDKFLKKMREEEAKKNGSEADKEDKSLDAGGDDPDEEEIDNDDVYGIFKDLVTGKKDLIPDDFLEETFDEINDFLDNDLDSVPDVMRRFVKAITEKARDDIEDELVRRGIL